MLESPRSSVSPARYGAGAGGEEGADGAGGHGRSLSPLTIPGAGRFSPSSGAPAGSPEPDVAFERIDAPTKPITTRLQRRPWAAG